MIPRAIATAEQELRRAIERRQTGDISRCLAAYGEAARNHFESLRSDDPMRIQMFEQVLSVLEWARLMIQTQRSIWAEELRALDRMDRFLGAEPSGGPRLRLDF